MTLLAQPARHTPLPPRAVSSNSGHPPHCHATSTPVMDSPERTPNRSAPHPRWFAYFATSAGGHARPPHWDRPALQWHADASTQGRRNDGDCPTASMAGAACPLTAADVARWLFRRARRRS